VPIAGEAATVAKIAAKSEKYLQALEVVAKKVMPHLPAGLQRKLQDAIDAAKKKIEEIAGKNKPAPAPASSPPPAAGGGKGDGVKAKGRDCKHLEKGPPGAKYQGGKHGKVKKDSSPLSRESHHIPPDSISPHGREVGPAISMDYKDHRALSSTGRQSTHPTSIAQKTLAQSGPAGLLAAMLTEITEIRAKFGDKYDPAIAWMLLYAACMGYIPST
jgi:hypothetical protein